MECIKTVEMNRSVTQWTCVQMRVFSIKISSVSVSMSVYLSVNMCGMRDTHHNIINIIKCVIWRIWIKSVLQVKMRLKNSFLNQILNVLNFVKKVIIKISFMQFQTAIRADVMMAVDINWILMEDLIIYGFIMIIRIESVQIRYNVHQIIN